MTGLGAWLSSSPVARVLVALGAVAILIALERAAYLWGRGSVHASRFLGEVRRLVGDGRADRAERVCAASPKVPLARVVGAGLARRTAGPDAAAVAARAAAADAAPEVTLRLAAVGLLADVAAMVGIAGSVAGVALAFRAVGGASSEGRQGLLASGLADALTDAGAGIGLAALLVLVHGLLEARAGRLLMDLERGVALSAELAARGVVSEGAAAVPGPGSPTDAGDPP